MNIISVHDHKFYDVLDKNSLVLDFGANIGEFSEAVLYKYGCKVIAYEPFEKICIQYLKKIKKKYNQFEYFNQAVWCADQELTFWNYGKEWVGCINPWGANTVLEQSRSYNDNKDSVGNTMTHETYKVAGVDINMLLSKFLTIDLIKIDIEGSEIVVLNSINKEMLQRCKQITVEFHSFIGNCFVKTITERDVNLVVDRIKSFGFKAIKFSNHPDYLFIKI